WVIGDPNQAIYGFRGSDKAFIDRFTLDYPQAHKFELLKSFRCSQPIIEAAGRLANTRLEGVNAADTGSTVSLYRREYSTEKSEAEGIARTIASLAGGTSFFAVDSGTAEGEGEDNFSLQECAVLVRAAVLAGPIVKALGDHGIPCELTDSARWWEEEPVKQVLDLLESQILETAINGDQVNRISAEDEINYAWKTLNEKDLLPKQKTNAMPETVSRLVYLAGIFGSTRALLDSLSASGGTSGDSGIPGPVVSHGVKVMTIHASKGLEFDHVFIPCLEDGILPFTLYEKNETDEDYLSEERRLLYVAMTRARRGLWLSRAGSRFFRGRVLKLPASRFLAELENLVPLLEDKKLYKRDTQMDLF
ncbi:MAG: ATP-dependent helicase, partial [Treponema sp.]|nr:ATP-dependent helicase [Treponema sp.]